MSHQSQGGFDTMPDPSTSQRRRASFNRHATYRRLDKPPVPPITPPPPPSKQFPTRRYIHPYLEQVHPPLPDIDIPIISLLDPTGTENLKDQYNIFPICRKPPLVISTLAELGALAAGQSRDTLCRAWVDQTTVASHPDVRPVGAAAVPCYDQAPLALKAPPARKMAVEAAVSHETDSTGDGDPTSLRHQAGALTMEGGCSQGTNQLGASVSGISRVDTFAPAEVSFKERIEKWASTAEAAGGEGASRRCRAVRNLPSLNDLVPRSPSPLDSIHSVFIRDVPSIIPTPDLTPIPQPPMVIWRNQQVHPESSSYHTLLESVSKLSLNNEDQRPFDYSLFPSPIIPAHHHTIQDTPQPIRYDPYLSHQQLYHDVERGTEAASEGEEVATVAEKSGGSGYRSGSSEDGRSVWDWPHRTALDAEWVTLDSHPSQQTGQISATILSSHHPSSPPRPTHYFSSSNSLLFNSFPAATSPPSQNPVGQQYTHGSTAERDQHLRPRLDRQDHPSDVNGAVDVTSQPAAEIIARSSTPPTPYLKPRIVTDWFGLQFGVQPPFIPIDIISLFAPSNIFEPQPQYSISNYSSPIQQLAEIRACLTHATIVMHLILSSARFLVDRNNQTISLLDSLAQAGQSPGSAKSQAAILDHGLPLGEAVKIEALMKIWWYSEGGRLIRLWRYITDEIVELVRQYEGVVCMADDWEVDEMLGYEGEWWEALRVFVEPTVTSWANHQTLASPVDERYLLKLYGRLETEGRVARGTFWRFNNRAKGIEAGDEVAVVPVDPVEVALVGREKKARGRWREGLTSFLAKVSEVSLGVRRGREEDKPKLAEVPSRSSVMPAHPVQATLTTSKALPAPPPMYPHSALPNISTSISTPDTGTSTPSPTVFDTDVLDRFLSPRPLQPQIPNNDTSHITHDPPQITSPSKALALATAEIEPRKEVRGRSGIPSGRRGMDEHARDDIGIGRKSGRSGGRVGGSRRPSTAEGVLSRFGVRIRS